MFNKKKVYEEFVLNYAKVYENQQRLFKAYFDLKHSRGMSSTEP